FCSRRDHSERGYAKRQRSRPRVTTKEAPNPSLNLEGMNRRPLSSRECRYSPMNIPPSPLPPTFPHFPPHCKLYHMHSKKSCIAETTKSGAASCAAHPSHQTKKDCRQMSAVRLMTNPLALFARKAPGVACLWGINR